MVLRLRFYPAKQSQTGKKNKGPLSLQIDFSPIMVSFLGEKIPEEKFIGTYLEKE